MASAETINECNHASISHARDFLSDIDLFRIGYFLRCVRERLQPGCARGGHWAWTVGCALVPRSVRRLECVLRAHGLLRLYTSELNGTACTIVAAPKLGTTTCHYFD